VEVTNKLQVRDAGAKALVHPDIKEIVSITVRRRKVSAEIITLSSVGLRRDLRLVL